MTRRIRLLPALQLPDWSALMVTIGDRSRHWSGVVAPTLAPTLVRVLVGVLAGVLAGVLVRGTGVPVMINCGTAPAMTLTAFIMQTAIANHFATA